MIEKRLNQEALKYKGYLVKIALTSFISGGAIIAQAYLIAYIINGAFLAKKGLGELWPFFPALFLIVTLRFSLGYFGEKVGANLASKVTGEIRNVLLEKIAALGTKVLLPEKTGELLTLILEGVESLEVYYARYLPQLISAGIIPLMILVVVLALDLISGIIMLLTAPLIPVFMMLIGSFAEKLAQKQWSSLSRLSGKFFELLQGIADLKAFGRSKEQVNELKKSGLMFRDATMEVLRVAFLSALALEVLATISTAMVAVEVGLRLLYGKMEFLQAFFVLLLAPELYLPLRNLGSSFHAGRTAIAFSQKLWTIIEEKESRVFLNKRSITWDSPPEIILKQVSHSYIPGKEVLKNINLTIKPLEKVAIVGPSGAGKSTLVKLLLGLMRPAEGEILINGVPLWELKEKDWYDQVGYLHQTPFIFPGSIAENIALGKKGAKGEEIKRAASLAGAHQFIAELPQGYDTKVGEGGRGLSGGERQRIALARVFLKDAKIVILDEPTAGLDAHTEKLLEKAFDELFQNRTVIIIAHRLSSLYRADKIILIDRGEIRGMGRHEQLLAENELYRQLITAYRGEV
ncbi:thiol reductant ABC exporter subunit CydD [Carboxydothermus hydrogenoformans]|uniref:Transport ATP-binding protein CydD n=1 Tax=Carboxydothermus hydrogenoformans (strain ATCC BAA-161 / DSM 6008 / Z-2901) TaxID=246194 RepID=Q3A9E7_CARHZ|nr:thiol reductant ABC exporter subunit CydD [Carboxydothermus hydrogenoformans]ABB15999.1 transport ATP-binding protein CydD [Carboxydothermus hydrogenoformans Z-2901]